jgi:hypothetical protein
MATTCNQEQLISMSNTCFVQGTQRGNRRATALRLSRILNFKGGYRAAYRAVKAGYLACDTYAGPLNGGGYGINCHATW